VTEPRDATVTFSGRELDALSLLAHRLDCTPRDALEAVIVAGAACLGRGEPFERAAIHVAVDRAIARINQERVETKRTPTP
jgi:hypothetical protein